MEKVDCERETDTERHRDREADRYRDQRQTGTETDRDRQDKTNSLFPRVMNKYTSAFLHSALAQRRANLLRVRTANTILHTLTTFTLSVKNPRKKTRRKNETRKKQNKQTKKPRRDTDHTGR